MKFDDVTASVASTLATGLPYNYVAQNKDRSTDNVWPRSSQGKFKPLKEVRKSEISRVHLYILDT